MIPTRPTFRSITRPRAARLALGVALASGASLLVPSCATEDVGPDVLALSSTQTDDGQGALLMAMAPDSDTYTDDQNRIAQDPNEPLYGVRVDGKSLVADNLGAPWPITVSQGTESSGGYLAAGVHHFEFVTPNGGPTIFAADFDIQPGQMNRIYLFGHLASLQATYLSYPLAPAAGTEHVVLVNLLRTGQTVEVVSCTDASTCTAVSPPVAYGGNFQGDFPATPNAEQNLSLTAGGAGVGYRATDALLPVPVNRFIVGIDTPDEPAPPLNYVSAPVFMSPDGDSQVEFN